MPKYTVSYAVDVPCYGEIEIDANSPQDAEQKTKQMHLMGELINEFEPLGELGENERVVSITTKDECVSDGFDLDAAAYTNADRFIKIMRWAADRYRDETGLLVWSKNKPTKYAFIERLAWEKYIVAEGG